MNLKGKNGFYNLICFQAFKNLFEIVMISYFSSVYEITLNLIHPLHSLNIINCRGSCLNHKLIIDTVRTL